MDLTEAYIAKRIALSHLQSVTKYSKYDLPKVEIAKVRYQKACNQYDKIMMKQNNQPKEV